MNLYQFETDQLGISETGLHLLRNRFNYETINFSAISQISLEKGRQIKNGDYSLIFDEKCDIRRVGSEGCLATYEGRSHARWVLNHAIPIAIGSTNAML